MNPLRPVNQAIVLLVVAALWLTMPRGRVVRPEVVRP